MKKSVRSTSTDQREIVPHFVGSDLGKCYRFNAPFTQLIGCLIAPQSFSAANKAEAYARSFSLQCLFKNQSTAQYVQRAACICTNIELCIVLPAMNQMPDVL